MAARRGSHGGSPGGLGLPRRDCVNGGAEDPRQCFLAAGSAEAEETSTTTPTTAWRVTTFTSTSTTTSSAT
eukprot:438231-Heterocapsa_arctica.AAC.1